MSGREVAFTFELGEDTLVGILHETESPPERGVVMVVGGPQYRVGGHRHYVKIARYLSDNGVPVLRYDYRGIGDSTGTYRGFENLDADVAAGIDAMQKQIPGLEEFVLWGLCESSAAIALYAHQDPRVVGVILVNPYASTSGGRARTMLRHYYLQRLVSGDFWRRLFSGQLRLRESVRDLAGNVADAGRASDSPSDVSLDGDAGVAHRDKQSRPPDRQDPIPLPDRLARGLEQFAGHILFVISGNDLTAREFLAATKSRHWAAIMRRSTTTRLDVNDSDHTFSRSVWLDQLAAGSHRWLNSW